MFKLNLKKIFPTGSVFFQSMVIFQEMVPGGFPVDPTRKRRFILIYSTYTFVWSSKDVGEVTHKHLIREIFSKLGKAGKGMSLLS